MLGKTLNRRYLLEQLLARAESGALYLATDTANGEMLAVKVFPAGVDLASEDGLRYRGMLSRLSGREHPHLLLPTETGTADGVTYQVLPYYPAEPLDIVLGEGALEPAQAVAVVQQVAMALDALHRDGTRHGNLKPANVLVSREDGQVQAVLADPGRQLLRGAAFPHGDAAAAAWCAPEEAPWLELAPDARADLYVLGLLAYRMLAGRLPYEALTARQMFHHHLVVQPPSPHEVATGVPQRLSAVVMKLLAKRPRERYQSTTGLLADLETWEQSTGALLGDRDRARPFASGARLFGRESARQAVLSALARTASGKGGIVVLGGGAGMGKRALLEELHPNIEAAQALLLRVQVAPGDWAAPFSLPVGLLRALLLQWETLPDLRRRDLLFRLHRAVGESAAVLTGLLPELGAMLPESAPLSPLPTERERLRVLHVLCEALLALADAHHPLVLGIGDLHWADADSVDWLRHLALRLRTAPALAIVGYDPLGHDVQGPLARWLNRRGREDALTWVELPALQEDQCMQVVAETLGLLDAEGNIIQADGLSGRLATWLRERWGGQPLACVTALRTLAAKGWLYPVTPDSEPLRWRCDWEAVEASSWPETLTGLLRHRLELLPDDLLLTLQAAAVFPAAFAFDALAALLDHYPRHLLLGLVEQAEAEGLLRRTAGGLCFSHPRLRESVYHSQPQQRREQFHLVAGALQESHPPASPLVHHHELALHFKAAGDGGRYLDHGLRTARAAGMAQALRGLTHWAALLQPLLRRDPTLPGLMIATGTAHAVLGNHELALSILRAAGELQLSEPARLEVLRMSAWLERARGNLDEAVRLVEEGLHRAGETLPAKPVGTALARLAGAAARRYESLRQTAGRESPPPLDELESRTAALLELAAELLAATQPNRSVLADEKLLRLAGARRTSPYLARALLRLGEAEGDPEGEPLRQARALLDRHLLPHEEACYHLTLGRCLAGHLRLRQGRETIRTARTRYRQIGDVIGEADALLALFELDRLQGPVSAMAGTALELTTLAGLLEQATLVGWGQGAAAYAEALAGRLPLDAAGRTLSEWAGRFAGRNDPSGARHLLAWWGDLALGTGDLAALLECHGQEGRLPDNLPSLGDLLLAGVLCESHLVQAVGMPDARQHHLEQARRHLRALAGAAETQPRLEADIGRLGLMERFLRDDGADVQALLEAEASRLEREDARMALARLAYRAAEGLKARGDHTWLHWGGRALTLHDSMGAVPFTRATRALLELEPSPEPLSGDAEAPWAGTAGAGFAGTFQPLLERMGGEGPVAAAELNEAVLSRFLQGGEGEYGGLFLPNADGQLTLARCKPGEAAQADPFNRWLVDTAWETGEGQVLENYQPPEPEPGAYLPEAQSLIGIPLVAGQRRFGVVVLGSAMSRLVYDHTHLHRLSLLGREAGTALLLNETLEAQRTAREAAEGIARRRERLLDWTRTTSELRDPAALLQAYVLEAAAPAGFLGGVLLELAPDGDALSPAAQYWDNRTTPALPALPWPEESSQARHVLETLAPLAVHGTEGVPLSAAERRLLEAAGVPDGLWLPLEHGGRAFGAVLLGCATLPELPAEAVSEGLLAPLRLLAPAWHHAHERTGLLATQTLLTERLEAAEHGQQLLRHLLPPPPPGTRDDTPEPLPEQALQEGLERRTTLLRGEVAGLAAWFDRPRDELMGALRAYYGQVEQGLALHQGVLERIQDHQWVARLPGSPDGALWAVQTLHELLEALREEQPLRAEPALLTGLGLHLGDVLWGAVPAGKRLAPLLTGEGLRTAGRLAAMALSFRCGALVSEPLVRALKSPERFQLRPLGRLRPAPGEARVGVYELYSLREAKTRKAMGTHHDVWTATLQHFRQHRWREAAEGFAAYAEALPDDRAARYFLRLSRQRAHT